MTARRLDWLFPLVLLIGLQAAIGFSANGVYASGELWGPDEYMRLLRVERLYETGLWFDGSIPRANAPFGETLHWTRPLDLLILAGAWPLFAALGERAALELSGALVSPLLQAAALAALLWAARPLLNGPARFCLGVFFVCQPPVLTAFAVGRPDHHGLLLAAFIALVGCLLRALDADRGRPAALLGGLVAAGSLWISVEALLPIAGVLLALQAAWLARGGPYARRAGELSAVAALGALLAVAAERPWPWLDVEYDRISIVHPAVLALSASLCALQARIGGGAGRRLAAAGFAAALGLGAILVTAPKFLGGPLVEADPWIIAEWDPKLLENWPLFGRGHWGFTLAVFLLSLGLSLAALPWLARALLLDRERRLAWAAVALLVLLFMPLGISQQRWTGYAAVLLALPYADLGGRLVERCMAAGGAARLAAAAARGALALALGLGFSMAAGAAYGVGLEDTGRKSFKPPVTELARHLGQAPELQDRPRRILACGFHGPELLYRSRHEVVATPYHRNARGLRDAHAFFTAEDEAEALAVARRRGADLVAIFPKSLEETECFEPAGAPFYRRLAEGRAPAWLTPLPLPPELAGRAMAFTIGAEALSR